MRWPRIIFLSIVALFVGGFLNYTLSDRQVVRIVATEIRLECFSNLNRIFYGAGDSGAAARGDCADIFFIQTIRADGRTSVFRNEDTGLFGWPPYFKTRSQDLQTEAADLVSSEAEPRWVLVRHYGWRSNWFSIYPNALSLEEIESPDIRLIPWQNIAILLGIGAFIYLLWRIWERFEDRVIEPLADRTAVRWAKTRDWLAGRR